MKRMRVSCGFGFLLAFTCGLACAAPAANRDPDASDRGAASAAQRKERQREGNRFEGTGRFEISGDRVTFYPAESQESYRVLENLALERVARVLGESREPRQWKVVGTFTEFQGGNYLLLNRATVRQTESKAVTRP
jgi:hypothetical protein